MFVAWLRRRRAEEIGLYEEPSSKSLIAQTSSGEQQQISSVFRPGGTRTVVGSTVC
jgi:hypothetical protein